MHVPHFHSRQHCRILIEVHAVYAHGLDLVSKPHKPWVNLLGTTPAKVHPRERRQASVRITHAASFVVAYLGSHDSPNGIGNLEGYETGGGGGGARGVGPPYT